MEIQPTYVTFEQTRWLKEIGWDINTYSNCWVKTLDGEVIHNKARRNIPEHDRSEQYLMQPEQWQVVEWLRVKHNIIVYIEFITSPSNKFRPNVITKDRGLLSNREILTNKCSYSPQEAYSAAFDYIKDNNLITIS